MDQYSHSVTLDSEKCKGCTNCIKRCPTQAIRVQGGKAKILPELCIDCGECIRVCPHHAKRAVYDPFESIEKFKYKIAIPAPSLYGQINNLTDINYCLTALIDIGFDDVFEVATAAEIISNATSKLMKTGKLKYPVISSACPAVERLIRIRFPRLCENILPFHSPMEYAARLAKRRAAEKTGLDRADIGVFFISPCPAKITDIKHPINSETSSVDGALAISDIYPRLVSAMNKIEVPKQLANSSMIGVGWANSGGESIAIKDNYYLAADGIENVIKVLEEVEDDKLNGLHFIELNACSGGCVGGVLTVENPYVAKARIHLLKSHIPCKQEESCDSDVEAELTWKQPLTSAPALKLSEDLNEALEMMRKIEEINKRLPGLDCGSCGSPTCRALAEDIVRGHAVESDCVFKLRDKVRKLAQTFETLNIEDI